jgi:hypothetical protein
MIDSKAVFLGSLSVHSKGSSMTPAIVPVVAFAVCSALLLHFRLSLSAADAAAYVAVGSTVASVGATMLGFMLASLAVLASVNHTHLIGMMRKTGHYADLLATIFYACILFFLCTAVGFMLVFGHIPEPWLRVVAVALHVAAAASLLDVGRKFWLVLGHLSGN